MIRRCFRYTFCIVVLALTGCIALPVPHDRQISPEFFGIVTDAETGLPIAGAQLKVSLSPRGKTDQESSAVATSGTDGSYRVRINESTIWYVIVLGPAEGFCAGKLSVSHPDYEPTSDQSSQFRGAAVNGQCHGHKVERNVQLRRRPS